MAEGVSRRPLAAEVQALVWVFPGYFTFSLSVSFIQYSILIHCIITVNSIMNWNTQTQLTLVLSGKMLMASKKVASKRRLLH